MAGTGGYYNPYYVPQAAYPQYQAPAPQPAPQPQYQYYNYIVVNSESEAGQVQLEMNTQILMLDLNNGKAYVRKRDGLGQYTMEKFLVVKEEEAPGTSYVTKEEFEAFKKMMTEGKKDE